MKIIDVTKNSPLYGFANSGDIITSINGKKVNSYNSLKKELYRYETGDKVTFEIISFNKKYTKTIKLIDNEFENNC